MSDKDDFDPMKAWAKLVTRWEHEVNDLSAKVSSSEAFGGAMNQASTMSRAVQQSFSEQMEKMLKAMNMPTQGQMSELAERLLAVEDKLDRLAIAVANLTAAKGIESPTAPIRRTRQPPADDK